MIKIGRTTASLLAIVGLCAALAGCQKEGPAERAGKEVDNVVEKAGDKIEKAGESIEKAAEENKK